MTEGTKSYLIGCHQFFWHPLWVLMAWRLEYKSWPKWWEIICIFLHDVGICGREYLSDDSAKRGHWKMGADLSEIIICRITGDCRLSFHADFLCGGHAPKESGYSESRLFRPDKRSHLVCPKWLQWWQHWVEFDKAGIKVTTPPVWRKLVAENLKRKNPTGSHELYIKNRQ